MNSLIIGFGEIGKSLYEVLNKEYHVEVNDPEKGWIADKTNEYYIMHICFPYSDTFIKTVEDYQKRFKPKYTVIHSTVPIGVSKELDAIHSPVIGIHPHLEQSIKTFTKYLGGDKASEVANYFRRAGIKVYVTDKSQTTELMKILCTTVYGLNIEITKEIKRICDAYDIPFEMWTLWTNNYNEGYTKLGNPEYVRQNLVPLMIPQDKNSHCTINNTKLLNTKLTKLLDVMNANDLHVGRETDNDY